MFCELAEPLLRLEREKSKLAPSSGPEINSLDPKQPDKNPTPSRYNMVFKGVKLDPYRILEIYDIRNPGQQHAIKKLLRAGRGDKSFVQDITESRDALNRVLEMEEEK